MDNTLLKLQNGSDVRGVALETNGGPPVNLTPEVAALIAQKYAGWLARRAEKPLKALRIGVGHDSRLSAHSLKTAVLAAFAQLGAQGYDCGLASTPALFMGCVFPETDFDGGVMLTASHLPQNRNGLKFFTKDGGVNKQDVTDILNAPVPVGAAGPAAQGSGLMALYAAFLREKIAGQAGGGETPLAGLHVAVDAGNGAGGFFVRDVLKPLGANCAGSQFLEPDGHFPNHMPNPENAEAMASIRAAVQKSGADLGVIFDTDVDRMSAVLPDGTPVNRNAIIALMAAILAPENPGATVVTDSVTSDLLSAFLEDKLGLVHHRFKRGYRNVINEALRLNAEGVNAPLAIETSGHGALRENYFLDDGAYMAVRIIAAAAAAKRTGRPLSSLLEGYREPAFEAERRLAIAGEDFAPYGKAVLEAFEQRAKARGIQVASPSWEGVRLSFPGKGWMLLRQSLHDPVLPLNVEGATQADLRELLLLARQLTDGFERLDYSVLDG